MKLTRCFSVYLVVVLFAAVVVADWTDTYADDFSTDKAESDSYRHSAFWPKQAVPLSEPYLSYLRINGNPGLAFTEYKGRLAEVGYRFPLGPVTARRVIRGILTVDVSFPTPEFAQIPAGRLLVSVSPDGIGWSPAEPLEEARQEVPISSPDGACYVLFTGTQAVIDNLSVSLYSAPVTFRVPTDFGTIQDAIDNAADGDVIEVAKGTYSGLGNRDIEFRGKKDLIVRSEEGPQVTIIDCGGLAAADGGHRGFYFHEGEGADSVVSGFTIVGGRIFGSEIPPDPLAWTNKPSHPIGGGIYCEFSSPTIADCIIRDCGAELGGGIGVVGADPMLADCTIEQCIAGGLSTPKAGGRGAGIGLIGFSNVTLTNGIVRNNSAYNNSYGAGLYVWQSAAVVAGCTFSGNNAPGGLRGGGAYCGGTTTDVTFQNCIFSKNQADMGGGLFTDTPGRVRIINCTVAQNQLAGAASSAAGGIQTSGTDILINSSILWGNTGRTLTITNALSKNPVIYSDVQGGYAGPGNLDLDPSFAALNSEDYHLKSKYGRYDPQFSRWVNDSVHSPCIDAGDSSLSVGEEPGPNGGRINMGAYGGTRQASKGTFTYHVNQNGGSNYNTGRSRETAFATVQKGIDTAQDGDTVLVWPGVYAEELNFNGKGIRVQSAADAAVLTTPASPREGYAVSFYLRESSRSVLANFVIAGCDGRGAIFCEGASPTLKNLTIVGNTFGIEAYKGADPNIINCILWGNQDGDLSYCTARYSDIQRSVPNVGNISADPLFADQQKGDYHLQSEAGRYVYVFPWDTWVTDSQTSPCIDAGDPREDPRGEPAPNGNQINMGAHGGTPFASKSG